VKVFAFRDCMCIEFQVKFPMQLIKKNFVFSKRASDEYLINLSCQLDQWFPWQRPQIKGGHCFLRRWSTELGQSTEIPVLDGQLNSPCVCTKLAWSHYALILKFILGVSSKWCREKQPDTHIKTSSRPGSLKKEVERRPRACKHPYLWIRKLAHQLYRVGC